MRTLSVWAPAGEITINEGWKPWVRMIDHPSSDTTTSMGRFFTLLLPPFPDNFEHLLLHLLGTICQRCTAIGNGSDFETRRT